MHIEKREYEEGLSLKLKVDELCHNEADYRLGVINGQSIAMVCCNHYNEKASVYASCVLYSTIKRCNTALPKRQRSKPTK